jgi:hypothetical protein
MYEKNDIFALFIVLGAVLITSLEAIPIMEEAECKKIYRIRSKQRTAIR